MAVSGASLVQVARGRAAAELGLFKPGQLLQAVVTGIGADGETLLKIAEVLVQARLAQQLPPGTSLQLQVKTGGPTPQLVVLSQALPAMPPAAPLPSSPPVPLPPPEIAQAASPTPLIVEAAQVSGAPPSQAALATNLPPQGVPVPAANVPSSVTVVSAEPRVVASAGAPPQPAASAPATSPVVSSAPAPAVDPSASSVLSASPQSAQVVTTGGGNPLPGERPSPSTAPSPTATATLSPKPVAEQAAPLAPPPAPTLATPLVASTEQRPQAIPAAQTAVEAEPAPIASPPLQAPQSPQQPVARASVTPQAAPPPHAEEELETTSPLLAAQAAARPAVTNVAELVRTAPPLQPAPAASPPPTPPQAALAQMIPEATTKQNSVGPLLTSLAALVSTPTGLPEPILRAAMQVLGRRILVPPDGRVSGEAIERGVAQSGVFLEAALAGGTPPQADTKAALLNLRAIVTRWLGEVPQPAPMAGDQPAPPVHGLPPRAAPIEPPPLPEAPREIARLVHEQADAAISRVKLAQLASLPDAPGPRVSGTEVRVELPFLIGHELVMAQIQIAPDGRRREGADRRRGWTMRFAMNFSATGEVGAEVGVLGSAVNVALWAAEPDTAEALTSALPELTGALQAIGLKPGAIRVRRGAPEPTVVPSGQLLDSLS